jgi:hypothetical protein
MTNDKVEEKQKGDNELDQRVEKVENEMSKISENLNTVVSELKKSIIDVRAAVSEIENPFNLLRVVSSEKDLKKLNNMRSTLRPEVKSLVLETPEEKVEKPEEKGELELVQKETPLFREKEEEEKEKVSKEREVLPPSFKAGFGHLKWIWSLLDLGLNPEDIMEFSKYCEYVGYLPPNSSEYIFDLAKIAKKAKSKGMGEDQLVLNMCEVAITSGVKIEFGDVSNLVSMAAGKMKTKTKE